MSGFQRHRRSKLIIANFTGFEADLLRSLAGQLVELLRNEAAVPRDDIDPFVAGMKAAFPYVDEWVENDFRIMLRVTQGHGCPATSAEVAEAERIVGRPLTRHQDFAARLAAAQLRSLA